MPHESLPTAIPELSRELKSFLYAIQGLNFDSKIVQKRHNELVVALKYLDSSIESMAELTDDQIQIKGSYLTGILNALGRNSSDDWLTVWRSPVTALTRALTTSNELSRFIESYPKDKRPAYVLRAQAAGIITADLAIFLLLGAITTLGFAGLLAGTALSPPFLMPLFILLDLLFTVAYGWSLLACITITAGLHDELKEQCDLNETDILAEELFSGVRTKDRVNESLVNSFSLFAGSSQEHEPEPFINRVFNLA